MSTALNSNTLNVVAGLLLPGALIGLGPASGQAGLLIVGPCSALLTGRWVLNGLARYLTAQPAS